MKQLNWKLREREGRREREKRLTGEREREREAEWREIQPQAGGKSILLAKVVVWLRGEKKTQRGQRQSVQRGGDIGCFSLPVWVAGGRAWMVWSPPPWDAASVPCRSLRSNINYSTKSARYCDQASGRLFETLFFRLFSCTFSSFGKSHSQFQYFICVLWHCSAHVSGVTGRVVVE